eukprot:g3185.t1
MSRMLVRVLLRHRLKFYVIVQILLSAIRHRVFLRGLYVTILASLRFKYKKYVLKKSARFETEIFTSSKDGEESVLWWVKRDGDRRKTNASSVQRTVWIVLPGGMRHGDKFYTDQLLRSHVIPSQAEICLFHNPGIVNRVKRRAPPALTETMYIREYVEHIRQQSPGSEVSIIGFSAGGMLAIALARAADEARGTVPDLKRGLVLRRVIAVHCPDRIRDVFETHKRGWMRMDRLFALSLLATMTGSGASEILSKDNGGGFADDPWISLTCLYRGWDWMRTFTEAVYSKGWFDMEALWSCRRALEKGKFETPSLRIVSRNDPIIWTESCVDPALLRSFDEVIVQSDGGHCAAFDEPGVAMRVKKWCLSC